MTTLWRHLKVLYADVHCLEHCCGEAVKECLNRFFLLSAGQHNRNQCWCSRDHTAQAVAKQCRGSSSLEVSLGSEDIGPLTPFQASACSVRLLGFVPVKWPANVQEALCWALKPNRIRHVPAPPILPPLLGTLCPVSAFHTLLHSSLPFLHPPQPLHSLHRCLTALWGTQPGSSTGGMAQAFLLV